MTEKPNTPIVLGVHLSEFPDGEESQTMEFETSQPSIFIRPCEQDGFDLMLDVLLSRTDINTAIAMLEAAQRCLIEQVKQDRAANLDAVLEDILGAENQAPEGEK